MRSAFFYMIASKAVSLVLMGIGFAALSRLLAPAAFGHFAVALAIYALAEIVVQFGLRQFIISRSEGIARSRIAAAAGLSLAIAVGLCLAGILAATRLGGTLLPQPVASCLVPLSLSLLFKPFALGTESLLQRNMRFELISVTEVVRVSVDLIAGISLVLLGFGAVALGWAVFASHLVVTAMLLGLGGREARIWPRLGGWREFLVWGRRLTAIEILPKAADAAMIGALSAFQGMAVVGLFNRAKTIQKMLNRSLFEAISPVILPAMSSALRAGARPMDLYRLKLDYLSAICWPGFAVIALLAEPIVMLLLGERWLEAVPAVRILALAGLGLPVTKMSQKLFVAMDHSDRYLRLVLVQDLVRLPLAVIGAAISLEAFALAYVVGNWAKAVGITIELRRMGVGVAHVVPVLRAVALTAGALAGPAVLLVHGLPPGVVVAAGLLLALIGWSFAAVLVRHVIVGELRIAAGRVRRAAGGVR